MKQLIAQILQKRPISIVALTAIFVGISSLPLMASQSADGTHSERTKKSHERARANLHVATQSLAQQAVRNASKAAPTPERMTAAQRKALLAHALAVTPSTPPRRAHRESETPAQNARTAQTQTPASEQQIAMQNGIVISVCDQKLAIVQNGEKSEVYPVSTSRYGLGDGYGTYTTPLGVFEVAQKIGQNLPLGSVFKDRHPTGEVLKPNAPGRDPIVTRIIWLRGTEECNRNAYSRGIYIHGTPEERNLGRPASFGCIRMRSRDVVKVFQDIGVGTKVEIVNKSLRQILRENAALARAQATTNKIIAASPAKRTARR